MRNGAIVVTTFANQQIINRLCLGGENVRDPGAGWTELRSADHCTLNAFAYLSVGVTRAHSLAENRVHPAEQEFQRKNALVFLTAKTLSANPSSREGAFSAREEGNGVPEEG
jgi:hypothetical protein